MNFTAYFIGVITFLALIFTTAGLTIRNRNSSITSNLDQGYKPIMFTDFTLPKNNKRLQKRSAKDDVSVEGKEQDLRKNQGHIAVNTSDENTEIANTKSKIDISTLASLSPTESSKFLEYFEKEISELIKAEEQENKTIRQIMHLIRQKLENNLSEMKSKQEELETLQKNTKIVTNMLENLIEESGNKILSNHPEHDKKYEDEYFNLLDDEYKMLLSLDRLMNDFDNCLKKMIKTLNRMFEIFFYDYEFDYERFNKEFLRELVNDLNFSEKKEFVENSYFDNIVKARKERKEALENGYLKGAIAEEFYLKRRENDEKVFKIINKIILNLNNMKNNLKPEEDKINRFVERMKIVLEQDK
ncbi:hypothetical protein TUBRATIS_001640 [Tubulinosema ratisbonensis]|uniref:Uncharacterized protein n=1 Tax=Tubulinosema ratisbonensis TaxID=291195 RepID=A0A437AQB4_9MICR|nr:hypothetical protein TUBRATIS_001640 [Tubulinosema ratisbonensis]